MEINKIIGAVLLVLAVAKFADLVADAGGAPKPLAKPAYVLGGETPAQLDAKPQSSPEAKSDAKIEAKPQTASAESKDEAKPKAKPAEAKPKPKPAEAKPKAETADAKPQTASAEAKPEAQVAAIAPLLAKADAALGKKIARKCTICHALKKGGKNKVGPALWGIVGANKARGSFRYSRALKALGGNWDYAALDGFIKSPRAYLPGNKMTFSGIKRDGDRAALILYLRSLSDNPVALP